MGELQGEYEGRVEFKVVPAEVTVTVLDEIEAFGFTDLKHGMVVFASSGEALVKMPGHQFGRAEIVTAIETVLAAE